MSPRDISLVYDADVLRATAYSVVSGDPAARPLGRDGRSPHARDLDGRTKLEVERRARHRDVPYFGEMVQSYSSFEFSRSLRTWIDKETGQAARHPLEDTTGYRGIDVLSNARYLHSVAALYDLGPLVEASGILVPTQVGFRSLDRLRRLGLPVRDRWTPVDVATSAIVSAIQAGRTWIVAMDLPDAYGRLPHATFRTPMQRLGVSDDALDRLCTLVEIDALDPRSGDVYRSESGPHGLVGIAQGNPLSPTLLNVALAPFLRTTVDVGALPVTYGDDVMFCCRRRGEAERVHGLFARQAHRAGIPVRPLGDGEKASKIIDARVDPLTVLRTYVLMPDGRIGVTARRIRRNSDQLRGAHGRRPRSRVRVEKGLTGAGVRRALGVPLASRSWLRDAGLLEAELDLDHIVNFAERSATSPRGTREGRPGRSAPGHARRPDPRGKEQKVAGAGGAPAQGPKRARDHGPEPDLDSQGGKREREDAEGRDPKGDRGQTLPGGREGAEADGGTPSAAEEMSFASAYEDVPNQVHPSRGDAGISIEYPSTETRQGTGGSRRGEAGALLRVTPEDLVAFVRVKQDRKIRIELDLRDWEPDHEHALAILLRRARWGRVARVLVHPGQRWIWDPTRLGGAEDPEYDSRRWYMGEGLALELHARRRLRDRHRRRRATPDVVQRVELRQDPADRRVWHLEPNGVRVVVGRTDAVAGRLLALAEVLDHLDRGSVAVRVGTATAKLLEDDGSRARWAPLARARRAIRVDARCWRADGQWLVAEGIERQPISGRASRESETLR